MSVVQPGADLLVLTETGYGKRVPLTEFRMKHRGGQGVRLIALEGRKTGVVAAVQQVTELDEELVLISAHGQVVRTELDSINRYSSGARGVIVMRLNEGDRVVGIAAFRPGLAEGRASDDNDAPAAGGARNRGKRRSRTNVERRVRAGERKEASLYADQFEIYPGNSNPDLAEKICRYLGSETGRRRGVRVREREHLRQDHGQRPREGRLHRPAHLPAGEHLDHGAADHDRCLQARQRRADHRRRALLRLWPVRQEGPATRPDHGPPRRRHDHRRRRGSDADDGPSPGPDPGLLQYPGRRADRRPHPVELLQAQAARGPRRRDGPRVREAGPHVRRAPGRAAGDHREAPRRQPRSGRAHERHRRGQGETGDHRR